MGSLSSKKKVKQGTAIDEAKPLKIANLPVVWILGGPGSGKSIQCKRILLKYGFAHICVRDLLKAEVASGSDLGKKINEKIKKKEPVENDVVLKIIRDAMLDQLARTKGFLITGCPRNKDQAVAFEAQIIPCTMLLYFQASQDVMTDRILTRAESSGLRNKSPEVVKFRIQTFLKNNDEIIRHYPEKLKRINAKVSAKEVFIEVQKEIDDMISNRNEMLKQY